MGMVPPLTRTGSAITIGPPPPAEPTVENVWKMNSNHRQPTTVGLTVDQRWKMCADRLTNSGRRPDGSVLSGFVARLSTLLEYGME